MRLLVSLLVAVVAAWAEDTPFYAILGNDAGAWPEVLSSIGLQRQVVSAAQIVVVPSAAQVTVEQIPKGAILIVEGASPLAESLGFRASGAKVRVTQITDVRAPGLPIVWEKALDLGRVEVPTDAKVFARERWTGAPMLAGYRRDQGAVLWIAASPGERGYERFPYVLNALTELGMEPPFRSAQLWAFFDSSYRTRVDLDYFAVRWRKAGISALQVAAWHFFEAGQEQDAYLQHLIEACHREGIVVYAWLDLPHVSEKFWTDHPEWREKTALLQDAQLDWRKLMNLTNRECFRAVAAGVRSLVGRFDWDGINLAELYFESLEGIANPSRFTPMNEDVRAQFRKLRGFDPVELFSTRADEASRRAFLDFRSDLVGRMQEEWIGEMEGIRREKPYLDLVLTHVDDRFDSRMRDAIGADAARVLPQLEKHFVTFLIEDPATVWHLGPQRYHDIAEKYRALTPQREKLAIDLNIVNRYQDVYPTKQQTGTELMEMVHNATSNFPRVALYFENSLLAPDLGLLSAAAASATTSRRTPVEVVVDSPGGVGVTWKGVALVDGQPWPASDGDTVWLPPGEHKVEAGGSAGLKLVRLNAVLKSAALHGAAEVEFTYQSNSRAVGVFDRPVHVVRIDGAGAATTRCGASSVMLPSGVHTVTIAAD